MASNVDMVHVKKTVVQLKDYLQKPDNNTRITNIFGGDNKLVARFQDSLLMQISKNPKIALCTVQSILECAFNIALSGMMPDGRHAHLIPFKDKCTLIFDFKGIVRQILNNHDYVDIKAIMVFENEKFVLQSDEVVQHDQILDPAKKGKIVGCYTMVKHLSGHRLFCWMHISEIYEIRNNSQGYKSAMKYKSDTMWTKNESEMIKKTVIRRHSKTLKLDADTTNLMTVPEMDMFREVKESANTSSDFDMPGEEKPSIDLKPEAPKEAKPSEPAANK